MALLPCLPLPAALQGSETGTFTEYSIKVRLPQIVERTIDENSFTLPIEARLRRLQQEIPLAALTPIADDGWQQWAGNFWGLNWLEAPWLVCEIYFYRRIAEAVLFFESGFDPFLLQKRKGLQQALPQVVQLTATIAAWPAAAHAENLQQLFALSLWGNQADLSLFPVGSEGPQHADQESQAAATLVDDAAAAADTLLQQPVGQVDLLLDNAGFELCADLLLVDYLLRCELAERVMLHCKPQPFFVSDAMSSDVLETVDLLRSATDETTTAVGRRLTAALADGRLRLLTDNFWAQPTSYWQMPAALREQLAGSTLLISKGDANYRRWLGDRHWPFSADLQAIVCYTPAPLLLLRTLKSEIGAGLPAERVAHLEATEAEWLTSGRYGVMQFVTPDAK